LNNSGWKVLLLALLAAPAAAQPPLRLDQAARTQVGVTLRYDGRYERLAYPGGDLPVERGVCTDVVIRAYRKLGVDLQELVHKDMRSDWAAYPHNWGLKGPDPNIDHRRVPNLATFFRRHGQSLKPGQGPAAYLPGDMVTWTVPPRLPHIGIVTDQKSLAGVPLIVHNIGSGTRVEDVLFAFPITGHYRYPAR
jgi:uncharacterized protein YijF (DUF1287 family)